MKLFVEVDLEGVSGAVYGGYGLPKSKEGGRSELLMTLELNALVEGARAAGISKLQVCESHPFNKNCLIGGIDVVHEIEKIQDCDLLAFVGRHARAGLEKSVLSHTGSGRSVIDFRVNGKSFGELGIVAAYAGHFGVPAIFVSGDRAATEEAEDFIPNVTTVAVSEGLGNHSAICLAPQKAHKLIKAGIIRAIQNRRKVKPLVVKKPVTIEYELKYPAQADRFALVPGVTKKNDRTVTYTCKNFLEAYRTYLATSLALIWWDAKG
ncbi:MAG: M55 family metallopeptidase [Verrucomicrobia bacterium]|nr:M55 family metallopeptidase [Verrucomicrobiota bacterium]MBU1733639.1 M55 family metallopeptidase [Verrucomicrobiota bacterium]MBU1857580.1 M55 family metallopeptidase [Verrucomicrobiota bacterium]